MCGADPGRARTEGVEGKDRVPGGSEEGRDSRQRRAGCAEGQEAQPGSGYGQQSPRAQGLLHFSHRCVPSSAVTSWLFRGQTRVQDPTSVDR